MEHISSLTQILVWIGHGLWFCVGYKIAKDRYKK